MYHARQTIAPGPPFHGRFVTERGLQFLPPADDSFDPVLMDEHLQRHGGVAESIRQNPGRRQSGRIIIGCSGWHGRWWKGNSYQDDLPASTLRVSVGPSVGAVS